MSHELNDNDIRHIKNSHGEESNEKYPVTVEDLKQIPDIIKNYDDVLYVERNGKKGFYYVKQHNGVTYYLEATNNKNTVLSNKQMIKVSTGTIPDIPELRDAINKKWNIDSAPDDSVPRMYVQDVKNYVPEPNIPQSNGGVKESNSAVLQRVEALSKNGETITAEDAKAASGYGVHGAMVLADAVNNSSGQSFSQVKGDMHDAYLAGLSNKGMRFETDLQREAYFAGKKDRAMNQNAQGSVKSSAVKTLENDLTQQGVPGADRQNIVQAAAEIEKSLQGTKQSISSVVSGVRKITSNIARVISQKVGDVQNPWGLLHTNLQALARDSGLSDGDFVASYTGTYLDAMKTGNPERNAQLSSGVPNLSGAVVEYIQSGTIPDGVQNQEAFVSVAEDIANVVQMAENMIGNAKEQLYGERTLSSKDDLQSGTANGIMETSTDAKISYALNGNADSDAQSGVMWTIEEGVLTKQEVALFYQEIAKLNHRGSKNYQMSSEGEYIFDIENKLIYTDGEYSHPNITKVISFDSEYENEILFAKEVFFDAEETQSELEYATEIVESFKGQGFVTTTNFEDSRAYARQVRGRKGTDGGATRRAGKTDVARAQGNGKISYALNDEYWHTDLTKRQVMALEEELRKVGSPSVTRITDTSNWYMTRVNGNDVFVIYSTEDAKGPTILYETKTNARVEKGILMDILEDEENGKSVDGKPSFTERLSKGDWVSDVDSGQNNIGGMGTGANNQNVGVLPRQPQGNAGRAFWNVLENLLEIQESARSNGEVNHSFESEVNENEQGEDILSNDGGKRKYSKSSGGQTRKVDGRSRRHKERGETARKRRKYCQTLKDAGHTRKRVVLGHRCEVIPERHYTSEMRKIVRENKKHGIDETILVVGGIKLPEVDSHGKVKTARGMFIEMNDGRKIVIVQCDNEYYSPGQINDHELVHNDYGSERTQRVKKIILKTLPVKKRNELLGIIQDDYSGMLEDLEGDALEELVANILSEMHYLSEDFLELSKAYWNKDDAMLKRWEYEVSKKSFTKAVENSYADEMNRLNRQLVYDEHIQLREYIMSLNNNRKEILPTDCKEIGNNFYIWRNYNKNTYGILFSIPIEGNEDIINATRSEISSGTYRGTENFNTRANRIRGGKRGSTVLDGRAERTTAHRNDDRLFAGQPEGDTRGHSGKSRRDTSGNRIKYALDENGMWEMEHIFENDDPEGEAAMEQNWKAMVEKYGAIPKGENPARDVSVPKKTSDDKKVSQTVRTILEAKVTPDEAIPSIEKMVEQGEFSYNVYTDKQAIHDATRYIKKHGWVGSLTDWFDSVEKGNVSKEITAMGWEKPSSRKDCVHGHSPFLQCCSCKKHSFLSSKLINCRKKLQMEINVKKFQKFS